jgi:peptidyl-prolyl cis-trans isomerase SurA
MNRALQVGGRLRAKDGVVFAMLCLSAAYGTSASAQSADSSTKNAPAAVPATALQPQIPPPTTAPAALPPATPSMMPRVPGTQLDRVVAIVNDDLILDSDVNEEMRLQAFDPYRTQSEKLSPTRTIERLINRALIVQQLRLQPEDPPTDDEVNKQIDQLRRDIPACSQYHCQTKEGWDRFLVDHGFTEASFFARWKDRMTVLSYVDERFELGVNITPEQIQSYYDKTLLPEYQRQHAPAPKLESISGQIREVLLQQQISNLLQDWLKSLRAQGSVVVLHPGEEAP